MKKEYTDGTDLYGEGNIDVTNKVPSNKEINQMVLKSLDSSSLKASGSESATSNQNFVSGSKSKRRGPVLEIAGIKRLKFQNGEGTAEIGINKCTEEGTSFGEYIQYIHIEPFVTDRHINQYGSLESKIINKGFTFWEL